jgi:hypothetical protein
MLNEFVMMDTWLQSLQVLCDLEGAKAENAIREHRGEVPAYDEVYFASLHGMLENLRGNLR